jgi:phospholipid/cholesterol/gamma-HCH transport system substrate-binding protein
MRNLSPELKVGIFAIVVILILSYMTFKVGTLPLTWKKGYRLYVVFDNISGLDEKSRVKIAGVDSGIVEKIKLENGKAKLILFIEPDVKIYRNAKASLKMTGLLGDKYLALTTGTPDEPLLRDGDTITNVEPVADIDSLANELTFAAMYISDLAEILKDIFGEPEKKAIIDTIHNLRAITQSLDEILKEDKDSLHKVLVNLEDFSKALGDKGPGVIEDMSIIAKDLRDKGPGLIDDLSKAATELRELIEENRDTLKESMESIKKVSKSAGNIAERIEKGEGTLGKLLKDDKLYESLSKVAEKADKSLDVVDRLRTFMDFHTEYHTDESEWKGYFNLTLKPKKDKYYILGVVTDPKGSVETTETIKNNITTTEEKIKSRVEFTAQFARRFEDFALRIGMIESTFGFGADYFFNNDQGRIKMDIWDLSAHEAGAERAHAKIGVDYRIFKYVFISGGIDNLLNENRRGVYIGGGLKFEDEDFKYLFGRLPSLP